MQQADAVGPESGQEEDEPDHDQYVISRFSPERASWRHQAAVPEERRTGPQYDVEYGPEYNVYNEFSAESEYNADYSAEYDAEYRADSWEAGAGAAVATVQPPGAGGAADRRQFTTLG